jgi:putative transposase
VLNVSRSGYYDWRDRPASPREQDNELLLKHIHDVHRESRGTYGSPRVHAELRIGLGLPVNRKRVERLMRQAGVRGLYWRRRRGCTVRDPDAQASADLVNRDFTVLEPNRLWITDITEHPTGDGKVYCAAVMDAYSRLIVGWSIANRMRTELVTDALGMAIIRRRPEKNADRKSTVLHSDHGSQYTAWAFGQSAKSTTGESSRTVVRLWTTLHMHSIDASAPPAQVLDEVSGLVDILAGYCDRPTLARR